MTNGESPKKTCGIVMPISATAGYRSDHWQNVLEILQEAINQTGFEPKLVSNSDEATIIHKNIITNLISNEIVVCDVSSKNPNVMLELGLRLAIGKPVVVVKDSDTTYSFDTSPIEHIPYPADLRFKEIVDFKSKLASKIEETNSSFEKGTHIRFLQAFGPIEVPELTKEEVPAFNVIMTELANLRKQISISQKLPSSFSGERSFESFGFMLGDVSERQAKVILDLAMEDVPTGVSTRLTRNGSEWMAIVSGPRLTPVESEKISNRIRDIKSSIRFDP